MRACLGQLGCLHITGSCNTILSRLTGSDLGNVEYNARMRRLAFLLRCLALVTLVLLPACTTINSSTSGGASPQPVIQRAPGPIPLTLWHSWSGAKLNALNNLARSYERAHPDVRIRLQSQAAPDMLRQYNLSVADGSGPQLVLTPGRYVGELAEQQYIAPLDEAFATVALTDVLAPALEGARIGQQLYGLPITFDTLVLFYDRRRSPSPPATFDELLAINSSERSLPPEQRPLSLAYYLMLETTLPYLHAFGGAVVDAAGQPTFATGGKDATARWLEWLKTLQRDENVLASANFSAVDAAAQAGRALSVIDWSHRRANYAQVWGADAVGVAPLPALAPDQVPKSLVLSQVLCINPVTSPEQRVAAQNFMRFMLEPESQATLASRGGLIPVHRHAELAADMQPFLGAASQSQGLVSSITTPDVWRPLNDMFRGVISGATTVSEAVTTAEALLQPTSSP